MRGMTDALARARADLAAGRGWKARDRLTGMLTTRSDDELLDLLARASYEMGDLPAAGALWFVTGREDDLGREASAAWRERYGSDEARWTSLPAPVRAAAQSPHVAELKRSAERERKLGLQQRRSDRKAALAPDEHTSLTGYALLLVMVVVLVLAVIGCVAVVNSFVG
jgi:hypothetical protein